MGKQWQTILGGSKITADGDSSHEIKTLVPWKKSYDQPRQHILGQEDLLEKGQATHFSILGLPKNTQLVKDPPAMQETWVRSLGWEEGKGYPLQYSGLENSMDYTVHEVAKSWTRLSNFHLLLDSILKSRDYANKDPSSQGYGFSSSHVWMWELDYKENWAPKNWCFWTMVLEKTLKSPLDCKEIQPANPKGNQSRIFIGRTDVEAEAPILWPPDVKNWLIWKDHGSGKDWRWEEKGTTEDEMVGWHQWFNGHEFE